MLDFSIQWSDEALSQANRFLEFSSHWDPFLAETMKDLAEYAQEYFKPMLNVRSDPQGNGDTERSIKHTITRTGDDYEVNYTGLLSALYMDQGNFDPGTVLNAGSHGLKYFPVDARFGDDYRYDVPTIHGMGYRTPGVPTHWSEKTVEHMADDGVALEVAMKYFERFLNEVVIT